MQRLEVSGALRPIYGSLGVKRLTIRVSKELRTSSANNLKAIFYKISRSQGRNVQRELGN